MRITLVEVHEQGEEEPDDLVEAEAEAMATDVAVVELTEAEDMVVCSHDDRPDDDLQWRETTSTIDVEPITEHVGPAVSISAHILDIFKLFFTTVLIDLIVEQTNRSLKNDLM